MSSPSTLHHQIAVRSSNKDLSELMRMPPPPAVTGNRLTKLLINVTIERSFGPVHVIVSPDTNVGELIKAAVDVYVKEKRRPLLADTNDRRFKLHYSQFSLESIKADEKLMNLGSRNFFLCAKSYTSSLEVKESRETKNSPFILARFMDFLL